MRDIYLILVFLYHLYWIYYGIFIQYLLAEILIKNKKKYCESKGTDYTQQTWNFESHISLISEGVNLCKIKTSWFYTNYRLKYLISKG